MKRKWRDDNTSESLEEDTFLLYLVSRKEVSIGCLAASLCPRRDVVITKNENWNKIYSKFKVFAVAEIAFTEIGDISQLAIFVSGIDSNLIFSITACSHDDVVQSFRALRSTIAAKMTTTAICSMSSGVMLAFASPFEFCTMLTSLDNESPIASVISGLDIELCCCGHQSSSYSEFNFMELWSMGRELWALDAGGWARGWYRRRDGAWRAACDFEVFANGNEEGDEHVLKEPALFDAVIPSGWVCAED
ncbi:hypothetical protein FQA39_LY03997 [Lamprigera yunnana]|nr:hypothetical protein FQA39_LY03997 [Lamprigera yunnana]